MRDDEKGKEMEGDIMKGKEKGKGGQDDKGRENSCKKLKFL